MQFNLSMGQSTVLHPLEIIRTCNTPINPLQSSKNNRRNYPPNEMQLQYNKTQIY